MVMAFDSELEAFDRYAELYPCKSVLLIDTYNTLDSGIVMQLKQAKSLQKRMQNWCEADSVTFTI